MADLSAPDVFAPDDRVALFCVSMAMAANDVEYAIRQAVLANPDGARTRNGSVCGSPRRCAAAQVKELGEVITSLDGRRPGE